MGHLPNVGEAIHAERIRLGPKKGINLVIEAFGMQPENLRRIHAEWAIDKHRHRWQLLLEYQLVERINNLLRSTDREGRDDDFSFPFYKGLGQEPLYFGFRVRAV